MLSKGVRRRPGANSRRRPAAMLRPSYNSRAGPASPAPRRPPPRRSKPYNVATLY